MPPFSWPSPGVQKLAGEPPVRTKGNEPFRFLPLKAAQDLLHRRPQVVIPQTSETLRRSRKTPARELPGTPAASPDDTPDERQRRSPCCASRKPAAAPPRRPTPPSLVPIDLAFLPQRIRLRHAGHASRPAQLLLALAHVLRGSSLPPLSAPASPLRSAARCDAPYDAACAAPSGRLPGWRR